MRSPVLNRTDTRQAICHRRENRRRDASSGGRL